MEVRQIEYILKIAETGNITKAAAQLFVSQSALTQQLLKLEDELGLKLFHRTKSEMKLTDAGTIYCDYAKKIVATKNEAYSILNDMSNNQTGTLKVGMTRERGIDIFMNIYPDFYKLYPHTRIMPQELGVSQQHELIQNSELDLGFVTISEADKLPGLEYIHFYYENLLLAISRDHPIAQKKANAPDEPFATINLKDLKDEKFVLMFKGSSMRQVIDPLFKEAGFAPDLLFSTASNQTLRSMVERNLACSIFSQNYATNREKIAYFYLPQRPFWEMAAIYRKGHYMTKAAKSFIALVQDYCYSHAQDIHQDIIMQKP